MMKTENFLVEIGTEELPPKALKNLGIAFEQNLVSELNNANLIFEKSCYFAAPRRLAVKVFNLQKAQQDQIIHKRGPAIKAAFDSDNNPTKAALGWARGLGIDIKDAQIEQTDKGDYLAFDAKIAGKDTASLLLEMVKNALAKLPIPKTMRWGDKSDRFVRPVHSATLFFGDKLIEGEILGIKVSNTLLGHRFLGEQSVTINNADDYPALLEEKGSVISDFEKRKNIIKEQAQIKANEIGGVLDLDEELLDEVTALVEYPTVMCANFESRFLRVPSQALVYTMKGDQKYFPVYDKDHNLLPHFIFVSNINPEDPKYVIEGNEKVIRPRLSDAEFFFDTDLKTPLIDNLERLKTVLFQKELGTLYDKTKRIEALSGYIASKINADVEKTKRAALLSKCDLLTNMVFEFTETQGIMGMHYALLNGEDPKVANALNEQYCPRFSGDVLPSDEIAIALSLAEKIDTLTGIFGINQAPKGDKDPFALRRAALGVLRILVECKIDLDLNDIIAKSKELFADCISNQNVVDEVIDFINARFKNWYSDQAMRVDLYYSVLAVRPTSPFDFDLRMQAVNNFVKLPQSKALSAANKRVANILAKEQNLQDHIDINLCQQQEEKDLAEKILPLSQSLKNGEFEKQYDEILTKLAGLSDSIDAFFENVMVNCEDQHIRTNRLAILANLSQMFLKVADISLIQ